MSFFLTFTLIRVLGRCDLTWGSQQEPLAKHFAGNRSRSLNHAPHAFIQNKRYRPNPRPFSGVVNRNAVSVYQTEAVLDFIHHVRRRLSAVRKTISAATKQYRVRPCPKPRPRPSPSSSPSAFRLRCSAALPCSIWGFIMPRGFTARL